MPYECKKCGCPLVDNEAVCPICATPRGESGEPTEKSLGASSAVLPSPPVMSAPEAPPPAAAAHQGAPVSAPAQYVTAAIPKMQPPPGVTTAIPKIQPQPNITATIPKIQPSPDVTAAIPKVQPQPNGTGAIPRVQPAPNGTGTIPRVQPAPNGTGTIPRVQPVPNGTGTIPRVQPASNGTGTIPRVQPVPNGKGTIPRVQPQPAQPESKSEAAQTAGVNENTAPQPKKANEKEPDAPGALELAIKDSPKPKEKVRSPLADKLKLKSDSEPLEDGEPDKPRAKKTPVEIFFTVLFFVVVAALGVATAIYVVVPRLQSSPEESYVEYLAGSWISDKFLYADSDRTVCELLTVNDDGTFVLSYVIPDERDPMGYLAGAWTVQSELKGTVESAPTENRLVLLYTEGAENFYYDRYFVSREEEEMVLREYYDQEQESFFDMHFTKFK